MEMMELGNSKMALELGLNTMADVWAFTPYKKFGFTNQNNFFDSCSVHVTSGITSYKLDSEITKEESTTPAANVGVQIKLMDIIPEAIIFDRYEDNGETITSQYKEILFGSFDFENLRARVIDHLTKVNNAEVFRVAQFLEIPVKKGE